MTLGAFYYSKSELLDLYVGTQIAVLKKTFCYYVWKYLLCQVLSQLDCRAVVLNLACTLNHWGNYWKYGCLGPNPRDSDLIGLWCGLGIRIIKRSPGDFNVQLKWNTGCIQLGLSLLRSGLIWSGMVPGNPNFMSTLCNFVKQLVWETLAVWSAEDIMWECVRNGGSQAPPQTCWVGICCITSSPGDSYAQWSLRRRGSWILRVLHPNLL